MSISAATAPRLLRHESLETTMIYTHVARQGVASLTSPLDLLNDVADADVQSAVEATRQMKGGILRVAAAPHEEANMGRKQGDAARFCNQ